MKREQIFRQTKRLGQNFLNDPNILRKICATAKLQKEDHVIEIGPGKGSLTEHLAHGAGRVTAIEKDKRLRTFLDEKFGESANVRFVYEDILKTGFSRFSDGEKTKLVSNLPYNISTQILLKLLDERELFSRIVVMLQKEVAQRISSAKGRKSYGSLSVLLQSCFSVKLAFKVSRHAFYPVPEVDSAVVVLDPLKDPVFPVSNEKTFRTVTRHAFSSRRKTIRNSLGNFFERKMVERALSDSGIDQGRRAESLSVEEFAKLADSFREIKGDSIQS
ncbi:MAG: 16S rRNA (adenine(1518)-N(6)/adenine(1519)-N(6))-dimethyltransferase RsmA [Candidatus Dadabacteria bacterium]|nr:16S rRNA (adenine(1518)-N(6)/adenine(1519)-N(6))-dimethyltransferase RsmA [Candidatus Dadabacteria bacterium]